MKAVQYQKPEGEATVFTRNNAAETMATALRLKTFDTDPNIKALTDLATEAVTGKGKPASVRPTADWGRKFSEDAEPEWTVGVDTVDGTIGMKPGDWLLRAEDGTLKVISDEFYQRWFA